MKIAVTGYGGMVRGELLKRGCIPISSDILSEKSLEDEINSINPDVIIHCAAKTDVKWCEENKLLAFETNVRGTRNVVDAFSKGLFIYLSSVYVFNGQSWYDYSEKHVPDPINVYGMTKYAGEVMSKFRIGKTIIVRISKLFDYQSLKPYLIKLWNTNETIEFTDLIIRSYTYLPYFVDALLTLINKADNINDDVINICSDTSYSQYQFWLSICNVFGIDYHRIKARTYELKNEIPRPLRGGLQNYVMKKNGITIPTTIDGINNIKSELRD